MILFLSPISFSSFARNRIKLHRDHHQIYRRSIALHPYRHIGSRNMYDETQVRTISGLTIVAIVTPGGGGASTAIEHIAVHISVCLRPHVTRTQKFVKSVLSKISYRLISGPNPVFFILV